MKKGLIKAGVLLTVFVAALFVFGRVTNQNHIDLTTEMKAATLPVVVLYDEDVQINELHGYTAKMDVTAMRDTITPVSGNREIPILIRTYGGKIDEIAYELRSIDGERLVSDGEIKSFQEEDEQIQTGIPVQNLLEEEKEYMLIIKLVQKGRTCRYYTRIEDAGDCYVKESVAFAQKVHELTFSQTPEQLSAYWEPNASGDNSTLAKVTINSSLTQAGWAELSCDRLTTPVPSVKEMNNSYNVIVLSYVVTTTGADGGLEYYNVEEYYRVRYTSERMYLLNFERTMGQIFNGENECLYENYVQLGIRSEDVSYMANESGTVLCFVQEGDLWSYNQSSNRLAEVFSFRGHEGIDARENYMQHGIRILSVDEAGGIDYVVYGYMNRGEHEGESGISVYHYDSLSNTNEEVLFVAFDKSYEVLKAELGELLYENRAGGLYLLFNSTVYHVDLETLEVSAVTDQLSHGACAVSESNRYIAFAGEGDGQEAREICVMDLENGSTQTIRAEAGRTLRVLGFMQEELVYGLAADKHAVSGAAGTVQSPMYALRIVDTSTKKLLKEYRKKGYYIDSVEFNDGVLVLNRLTRGDSGYAAAQQDSIVNRRQEVQTQEVVHTTVTDIRQTQVQLTLSQPVPKAAPVYIAAKLIVNDQAKEAALPAQQRQEAYFAYARGRVEFAGIDVCAAIRSADAAMGVVVDERQNYIWKRARKAAQPPFEVSPSDADGTGSPAAACISALLKYSGVEAHVGELLEKGDAPQEILSSLLPERRVLDVSGCTLEQMFYYVSGKAPVLVLSGGGKAVLIVGYDALSVWIYDPQAGGVVKKTIEETAAGLSAGTAACFAVL